MSAFIVGLTGGIGSGKTAVARCFAALGIAVVDTDEIAHELTQAGGAAIPAIREAFGAAVLRADGALDRAAMRARVFGQPEERQRLEAILHPMIRQLALVRCEAASSPYVVLAVPLLIESGRYRALCARILVVDCQEATQVSRVMARSGLSAEEVRAIVQVQASREARLAAADDVVDNEGAFEALAPRIAALHQRYLMACRDAGPGV